MNNQNILNSGFNHLYNEIFCNIFPTNNGFDTCKNCNYGSQTIWKTITTNSEQDCLNNCKTDERCTSYSYNTSSNTNNCTLYRSFPTEINQNVENINSGYSIDKFNFNYNNLTDEQKQTVQKKCANQFLNNTFTPNNTNIDLTNCLSISNSEPSGTSNILGNNSTSGTNTFLNLDAECVYGIYNNNGIKTNIQNNSVYNQNPMYTNAQSDPKIDTSQNLYNRYNNIKKNIVDQSNLQDPYDYQYTDYNNTVQNNNNQLEQNFNNNLNSSKSMISNITNVITQQLKSNKEHYNNINDNNDININKLFLIIFIIIFVMLFIIFIFKKK